MRILILEDDPIRHKAFKRKLIGHHVVITDDSKECIRLLAEEIWDELYLDHDLGGQVYVDSGEGTGYEVAEWLSEHEDRLPPHIVIHSYNPTGAKNMKNKIPDAIMAPGIWL